MKPKLRPYVVRSLKETKAFALAWFSERQIDVTHEYAPQCTHENDLRLSLLEAEAYSKLA